MTRALCIAALLGGCGRLGFEAMPEEDAPLVVDVPTIGFCETQGSVATLCADFDDGLAIATGFTETFVTNRGTLGLGSVAKSAPGSLHAGYTAHAVAPEISNAVLRYQLPGTTSMVRVVFDLLFPARPSAQTTEVNDLVITIPGVGDFFNVIVLGSSGEDFYLEEFRPTVSGFNSNHNPIPQLSAAIWHHVDWELDLSARTYRLELDQIVVGSGAVTYTEMAPGDVMVEIGMAYAEGVTPGHELYIDNVVLIAN